METRPDTVIKDFPAVNGSTVSVFDAGTEDLVTIFDQDGGALSNPFQSGYARGEGEIEFQAANGLYDIKIVTGEEIDLIKSIALNDPNNFFPLSTAVVTTNATDATAPETGSGIFAGGISVAKKTRMDGGKVEPVIALTDANETLGYFGDKRYAADPSEPTASRDKTLPTTNVIEGTQIRIVNKAAFDYVVKSDNGDTIVTFQNGMVMIEALQDTPTTSSHWAVRENSTITTPTLLNETVLQIGDWNMQSTGNLAVAHGISSALTKIRSFTVFVYQDGGTPGWDINTEISAGTGTGGANFDATNINLFRRAGGAFDSSLFNATPFNRGYIVIKHTA